MTITEELLNEFAFAIQQARELVDEMKETRSLLGFTLNVKRVETTNRALLYFVMSDPAARNDIKTVAQARNDKEVLNLLKEFEDTF